MEELVAVLMGKLNVDGAKSKFVRSVVEHDPIRVDPVDGDVMLEGNIDPAFIKRFRSGTQKTCWS